MNESHISKKVQIPLKIVEIFPAQIKKVKSQRINAQDITGCYVTIVLFEKEISATQGMEKDEFFVIDGFVVYFNKRLQLNLGPDGQIYCDKEAWETEAGKLYASHLDKSNEEIMDIMIKRKNLTYKLALDLCAGMDLDVVSELKPRLAAFLFRKLFQRKKYTDNYFTLLNEIQKAKKRCS